MFRDIPFCVKGTSGITADVADRFVCMITAAEHDEKHSFVIISLYLLPT